MTCKTLCKYLTVSVLIMMVTILGFSCAQKSSSTTSNSTSAITSLTTSSVAVTKYQSLAVQFHALLTFSLNNTNVSYPTELAVPQVPITWNGMSFSGQLREGGPGGDITDNVMGTASPDGKSLVSLLYSRLILRINNTGTSFSVSASNIPLDSTVSVGIYHYTGNSLQGYVTKIDYTDGPITSGQIVPSTIYVSTDWSNPQQPPTLTLTFGK